MKSNKVIFGTPDLIFIGTGNPGNSSVVFEQGSLHIMFTQLREPLEEYIDQKVTLVFKNLGDIVVDFQVEKVTQKMNMKNNHDH